MTSLMSVTAKRPLLGAALVMAAAALIPGCNSDSDDRAGNDKDTGATETNVQPAPCKKDSDCPTGVECAFPSGPEGGGFCDVNDTIVGDEDAGDGAISSAQPAPCDEATDCPEGIDCKILEGSTSGFCDVEEMQVSPPSSAAPAPCTSSDECPEGIECKTFEGSSSGFCDVSEMQAP